MIQLMDPFAADIHVTDTDARKNTTGGKMYLNLGNISEDMMKDNRFAFENGLPISGSEDDQQFGTRA